VFINRSFNVVVSLMHLWVLALLTCMEDAFRVFKKMPSHDVVSWTALLLGHAKCRQGQKALQLFQQMKWEGNQTLSLLWGS
jgi:pentatricopeptide repeat protein